MTALILLRELADRWDFCLAMAVVGLLSLFSPWRGRTAPLAIPAFGFLCRKLLLFVPVCGAVSTVDQVVFWSGSAYIYFLLLLTVLVGVPLVITRNADEEAIGCLGLLGLVAFFGGSAWLLPVDGVCHLYMPILCTLAFPKLLLVSPVLLWACWLGFLTQLGSALLGGRIARHVVNLTLAGLVSLGGLVSLAGQGVGLVRLQNDPSATRSIREAQPRLFPAGKGEPTTDSTPKDESSQPEATHFLRLWRRLLPEINRTGTNLVEKILPSSAELGLPNTPGLVPTTHSGLIGLVVTGLLLSGVLAERHRQPGTSAVARSGQPIHHVAPLRRHDRDLLLQDIRQALISRATFLQHLRHPWVIPLGLTFFSLLIAGAFGPVLWRQLEDGTSLETIADILSSLAGVGFVPLALLATSVVLDGAFLMPEREALLVAFVCGNRQGRRTLDSRLMRLLGELAGHPQLQGRLLVGQPPGVLVDCLISSSQALRQEALRLLPAFTPTTDIARLAAANFTECRVAAASHPACPRESRLALTNDREASVRSAALAALPPVSAAELLPLIQSQYADVRIFAVAQPTITQVQLLQLASQDGEASVRTSAQGRLHPPSTVELDALIGSRWPDARGYATSQASISQTQLLHLARDDRDETVRSAAQQHINNPSATDLEQLIGSQWPGTRLFAANQPSTTPRQLITLCADADGQVARAAYARFAPNASAAELSQLRINPALWQDLASHALVSAQQAADLISSNVPRSRYVVDVPEEGYDTGGTSSSYVVTRAEEGHHEYDANDIALARCIIESVPVRRPAVFMALARINAELHRLVQNAP